LQERRFRNQSRRRYAPIVVIPKNLMIVLASERQGSRVPPDIICKRMANQLAPGRKNCSGASFGTANGVADDGSGLNLAKTGGLARKWF
jgi:hypothetical protein